MKYGICQWNLPVKGPEGCYALKELGLDGMELGFDAGLEEQVDEYIAAAKETGMEFPTLGLNGFCGKSYTVPGSEAFFEDMIARALVVAKKVGAKTLQLPAFFASAIDDDDALVQAAKNLRRGCELAEEYNVYIGIENALSLENNIRLFELVDHPLLKLYFDNQNPVRMKGLSSAEILAGMKDELVEVHLKDSSLVNGASVWMPIGEGECMYEECAALLKEIGYDGWMHLENDYQKGRADDPAYDAMAYIRADIEKMKQI